LQGRELRSEHGRARTKIASRASRLPMLGALLPALVAFVGTASTASSRLGCADIRSTIPYCVATRRAILALPLAAVLPNAAHAEDAFDFPKKAIEYGKAIDEGVGWAGIVKELTASESSPWDGQVMHATPRLRHPPAF
jgi:hypothetical protein